MSTESPLTHIETTERIAAYLAGGLEGAELDAMEQHLRACPDCQAKLGEARELEKTMNDLLADARPAPDFEDRVVRAVRAAPRRWVLRPVAWRIAAGIAAAVGLSALGYGASSMIDRGMYPGGMSQQTARVKSASNLRQVHQLLAMYASDANGLITGPISVDESARVLNDEVRLGWARAADRRW